MLPVVFESESGDFEHELFWTRPPPSTPDPERAPEEPQFVIEEEEEEEFGYQPPEGVKSSKAQGTPIDKKEEPPTLAERLFSCTIDLLFCCGFTLPTSIQVEHHKINYVIWYVCSHLVSVDVKILTNHLI